MKKMILAGLIGLSIFSMGCEDKKVVNIVTEDNIEIEKCNCFNNISNQDMYIDLVNKTKMEPLYYFDEQYGEFISKLAEYYNNGNGTSYTSEEFKNEFFIDNSTCIYNIDINNDGQKEVVLSYLARGTGHFSGIDQIFELTNSGEKNTLKIMELPEGSSIEDFGSYYIEFLNHDGKIYIKLSDFQFVDKVYYWDKKIDKVFSEESFINNDHLSIDRSEENKDIFEKYTIEEKLNELTKKEIDYTNCGYSNEEVLLRYFKIKDYIINDKKEELSKFIKYPIVYFPKGSDQMTKIYTCDEFLQKYDELVTSDIKEAVANSAYDELFSNWKGIMIGSGQVWFTDYIVGINDLS